MDVRTRFAPSPTGFLHVGSARTALFAWIYALQQHGSFVLRIEDTDKAREVEGAIGHIMESLKWLGVSWNESIDIGGPYEPYIQSARLSIYHEYARALVETGHAYPDPLSEGEIELLRKEAEACKEPFLYRNHRPTNLKEWDGKAPLRFRVPTVKEFAWEDLVMGTLSAGEEALDDFILIKADGYPTYNFAHVVDDITMRISHVMRGQEFISSTPKFLSLYEALKVTPPVFVTLPPILGETGTKKLSKRDGAKDILDYRTEGYAPQAMLNFLMLLGWHPKEGEEILDLPELLAQFDITRVQRSGAQFDEEKLLHINREWLRTLSDQDYLKEGGFEKEFGEKVVGLVPLLKERAHTFNEARALLTTELAPIFRAPELDASVLRKMQGEGASAKEHLQALAATIADLHEELSIEFVKTALMPYANSVSKEHGGRGAVLWPLRYALTGLERSPDPFTLISVLGRDEALSRLNSALDIL